MMNAKLDFNQMKEILNVFVNLKLNALKIGDLEIQKTHYDPDPSDNKTFPQEDPLFYSAANLPPELQEELKRMMHK